MASAIPNLLKLLQNADKKLDKLTSDLEGIIKQLQNSKMTEDQEEQAIRTADSIDANIARISAMRARLYENIIWSIPMEAKK
uniref:Uncharacterized protein n=1 Tax=viral metagenome TaxID=1070528 RepID=A0A6C0F3E5_9ZZZZ